MRTKKQLGSQINLVLWKPKTNKFQFNYKFGKCSYILHLCPEMHAMAKMAKLAKNRQPLAIWIGCQKWPLEGWRFWQKWRFWQFWQKLPCMQWRKWRNWRKITSLWRFDLDAKSGPLEAGEIGDFGKNHQRAGDSSDKCPRPLETGNFGENGDCSKTGNFGKNR